MQVIKAFQRPVLEIHPGYGRVFQLHEREPFYFQCHIRDWEIFLHQMYQVEMGLYQVPCGRRQPSVRAFPVREPCLGVPDDMAGDEFVRSILWELPHQHPCLQHGTELPCKPLACLALPVPGSPAALLPFLHELYNLLIACLHPCGEQQVPFQGTGRKPDVGASRILGQSYRLEDRIVFIK